MKVPSVIFRLIPILVISCTLTMQASAQSVVGSWYSETENIVAHEAGPPLSDAASKWMEIGQRGAHANTNCLDTSGQIATPQIVNYCWYASSMGLHSFYGNEMTLRDGSGKKVLFGENAQVRVIPTPNPDAMIELRPTLDGESFSLRRPDNLELQTLQDYGDTVLVDFVQEPSFVLRNASGSPWNIDGNMPYVGMWYSPDGKYMLIADHENAKLLRINLETFQAAHLEYLHDDGDDTYASFAVSNDGTIVVNVYGHAPRIMHTNRCALAESPYITAEAASCDITHLDTVIGIAAPDLSFTPRFMRFNSNTELDMYLTASDGGAMQLRLFAPGTFVAGSRYLAMGDSYASGEGARQYYTGTDRDENRCHLSKVSYPFLLGQRLGLDSIHSVACSGARIRNIAGPELLTNDPANPLRSNQYDYTYQDAELTRYLPGKGMQIAFADGADQTKPDIITVSISGNDAGFASILGECVLGGTCFETDAERASLVHTMAKQYGRLADTFSQLRYSTAIGGKVYVVGYPDIASTRECDNNVRLDASEITFLRQLTQYLNFIVQTAADRSGVEFIDNANSFVGHRLCEPGDKAMHGITINLSRANIRDLELLLDTRKSATLAQFLQESYHPTALGHELLADAITEQTSDMTVKNPRPDSSTSAPSIYDSANYSVIDDEAVLDNYNEALYYANLLSGDIVLRGEVASGQLWAGGYFDPAPNSDFLVKLYSDPVTLGTFKSDADGNLKFDINLPADTPPGYHRLRVFGNDRNGNPVEARQVIYVAATATDWDGDGALNSSEQCVVTLTQDDGTADDDWCEHAADPAPEPEPEPDTPPCHHLKNCGPEFCNSHHKQYAKTVKGNRCHEKNHCHLPHFPRDPRHSCRDYYKQSCQRKKGNSHHRSSVPYRSDTPGAWCFRPGYFPPARMW